MQAFGVGVGPRVTESDHRRDPRMPLDRVQALSRRLRSIARYPMVHQFVVLMGVFATIGSFVDRVTDSLA